MLINIFYPQNAFEIKEAGWQFEDTPSKRWEKLPLTAHNWQKWKREFLTCQCHKQNYRDEAVGL